MDAISPMFVSMIISLITLSDTMLLTVPGIWFRILSSIDCEDSANQTDVIGQWGRFDEHVPAQGSLAQIAAY